MKVGAIYDNTSFKGWEVYASTLLMNRSHNKKALAKVSTSSTNIYIIYHVLFFEFDRLPPLSIAPRLSSIAYLVLQSFSTMELKRRLQRLF